MKPGSVTLAAVYKDLSNKTTLNLSRRKSETFLPVGTSSIAKKSLHLNIGVSMLCFSHRGTDQFSLVEIGRVIFRIGPNFVSVSSQTHIFHRLLLLSAESCFCSVHDISQVRLACFTVLQRQEPFNYGMYKLKCAVMFTANSRLMPCCITLSVCNIM